MRKITLERLALVFESGPFIMGDVEDERAAALIRAAQKAVDAAEQIDGGLINFEGCLMLAVTPELVDDLKEALTAFRKLEEGE
jgi:formylmethanofuran:tetrahydromethanopterin formyltransferase